MQRLGVSRAAVSRRLFSNNANAKKDSSQPELVQAGAGRILSTGIVVAGAAVAYNMHVDDGKILILKAAVAFETLTISFQNSGAPSKKLFPVLPMRSQELQVKNTKHAQ